ncbi:GNAT family N-acetyltransferase [Lunatibacter salilacus]|uniref:GNAT family N-acetyltransferase n=1 Tax=Lunatibacter salilacus TaxID=2483804 RepID=UPI00131D4EFF|nr:GNAT family N-acetyltransferase [Lunatibacter salilacus]
MEFFNDEVKILKGTEVFDKMASENFLNNWKKLWFQCPWATVYQSYDFVFPWYEIFKAENTPILITWESQDNTLLGFFPLCIANKSQLAGAGLHHAEYQLWITSEESADYFIKQSLLLISKEFPGYTLTLNYIPENLSLEWCKDDTFWKRRIFLKSSTHPIMKINPEHLEAELKKKNKKEKINRLKRLGDLKIKRITDFQEFENIFDELAVQNDFRKRAVYNSTTFQDSPLPKPFLLSLFRKGILHVTILTVGKEIIASNVGTIGNKCVHLQGMNTHSPKHSKFSPGILHFLMLGLLLSDEHFEVFDLTPGSDPYKSTLANDFSTATRLEFGSPSFILIRKLANSIRNNLKPFFQKIGVNEYQLRETKRILEVYKEKFKLASRYRLLSNFKRSLASKRANDEWLGKRVISKQSSDNKNFLNIQRDSIGDLLHFEAIGTLCTPREFMEDALKRLEKGQVPYTICEDNRLLFCVWRESRFPSEICSNADSCSSTPPDFIKMYVHPTREKDADQFRNFVIRKIGEELNERVDKRNSSTRIGATVDN